MSSNTNKLILGPDIVNTLYLGSQAVNKLYLGEDLIYKGKEHTVITGYTKSNPNLSGTQTYTGTKYTPTKKNLVLKELQLVWNGMGSSSSGSDEVFFNINNIGWSYLLNIYPNSSGDWYMKPRGVSGSSKMPKPSSLSNIWNVYKMTYLKDENKYKYQSALLQKGNVSPLNDYGTAKGISLIPSIATGKEVCLSLQFTIDSKTGKQFVEKECYMLFEDDEGNTVKFALA